MLTTAIFPNRYVQGANALSALGEEAARLGKQALVLLDGFVAETLSDRVAEALSGSVGSAREVFGGECCDPEIDRLKAVIADKGLDVVIGVGGGKTLDTAKAGRSSRRPAAGDRGADPGLDRRAVQRAVGDLHPGRGVRPATCCCPATPTWCWSTRR